MENPVVESTPLTTARHDVLALNNAPHKHIENNWLTTSRYFLRSIGLGVLSTFQFRRRISGRIEQKKVVIETSVWPALARCCVHILPVLGSVVLFWFNFYGYYIGSQLAGPDRISDDVKLHLLQFVAKAHELLIISSTTTMVFSLLRNQLLFGSGIPLGLIGSGMSFSGISYFW
jgi:hypothetical protein